MRRRIAAIAAIGVLVSGLGATTAQATPGAPGAPTQEADDPTYDVYVGKLDARDLAAVRATGIDPHEMDISADDGRSGRRRGRAQRRPGGRR